MNGLTISSGTLSPTFASGTTGYTVSVVNSVTSITVTPTVAESNATVQVQVNSGGYSSVTSGNASGSLALNVGANTITTLVTAQDGTTRTYTMTVTRAQSSNADLSSLTISSGTLSPTFASGTTEYTISVANSVTSITVTSTVAESNATVQVQVNSGSYSTVTSGVASGSLALNVGANTITTLVTAQDGTTKTYTLTVTRAQSSNADLNGLAISSGTLSPTFASGTTGYTVSVTNSVTSITVTSTVAESNATVQVQVNSGGYSTVTSGVASGSLALNVGANTITTLVTAQDGTTRTYTMTVTRAQSSNADLNGLTISSGTLSPSFASGTTSYTVSVANSVTSITVTPTVAESNATVQVQVNSGGYSSVTSGVASGSLALNVGANTITTLVTAQDGTTRTYTMQLS